ncbi:MAG: hypothetical protein HOV83_17640 [Catenulispora sp.]|nr:hypothetical protein [Catenulispora sp.]
MSTDWFGGTRGEDAGEQRAGLAAEPVAEQRVGSPTVPATDVRAEPPAEQGAGSPTDPTEPMAAPLAGSIAEPNPAPNPDPAAGPSPDSTTASPARARFQVLTGGRAAGAPAEPAPPLTVDDHSATESADTAPPADFRVRCPDCGPQYVAVADVRFVSTGGGADTDRYLFTCPACGVRVRRPAGPELARILRTSGVATLALRRGPDQAL